MGQSPIQHGMLSLSPRKGASRLVEREGPGLAQSVSCHYRGIAGGVLFLFCSVTFTSCVSSRIEYFADETYLPRGRTASVEWLPTEPTQPYVEIARITVGSANLSHETLREAVLDRARRLGADAVIDEKLALVASQAPFPNYEPGLLGPKGAAFGLYGYGWYTPYSSNPYILTQGATDQPRLDQYLSAVAIRYQHTATTDRLQ